MADDVLNVDIEHLTVSEIEEIEERAGLPFDALGNPNQPKGKLMRALGFIVRRREDPSFTWEQAGELRVVLSGDEAVPPTDAAG